VLYGLFGESLGLVLGAQALIGSVTALLVFRIGVGLFGNGRGLLAGLLAASYGVAIYYDGLPLKVTLSLFLATLALQQVLRADALSAGERAGGRLALGRWFSGGLALGLAVLTRGNFLIFVPVLLAWVWLGTGPGARRVAATATAAARRTPSDCLGSSRDKRSDRPGW
jgi:4-amino-4-deoxy-L-arabinose transferase-like glycosyltransferase